MEKEEGGSESELSEEEINLENLSLLESALLLIESVQMIVTNPEISDLQQVGRGGVRWLLESDKDKGKAILLLVEERYKNNTEDWGDYFTLAHGSLAPYLSYIMAAYFHDWNLDEKAAEYAQKTLELMEGQAALAPLDFDMLEKKVSILEMQGKYDEVFRELDKILEMPNVPETKFYKMKGDLLLHLHTPANPKLDLATIAYMNSIDAYDESSQEDYELHYLLAKCGRLLIEQQNYQEALILLKRAVSIEEEIITYRLCLAKALLELYSQALGNDHDNPPARDYDEGHRAAALSSAEEIKAIITRTLELAPNDTDVLYMRFKFGYVALIHPAMSPNFIGVEDVKSWAEEFKDLAHEADPGLLEAEDFLALPLANPQAVEVVLEIPVIGVPQINDDFLEEGYGGPPAA